MEKTLKEKKLMDEVEHLIPKLYRNIYNALPRELQKAFADYTFLTLFDAIRPPTPEGMRLARRLVSKWKKDQGWTLEGRKE